ncbi:Aste57867_3189 [Aphanomyces stellatus]|uniref:Aste57867_3189 protein n=1 Tax=Aphanomyces stellatus TaxID=120398 RepID=A0A485K969_9STRA|nr:hypothetical protein As57867_003180 [Aphanomyces stellatus]VFT80363.1 Aste57867_3189 [Aphanomyces stellatus]
MDFATKRLRKEYVELRNNPIEHIEAVPLESNILEWHYVIRGVGIYDGGYYHGKLKFSPDYPWKPPSIYMLTPSGRFETNKRLCLSMSDYHPETWNPAWTVGTILVGLFSFMNEQSRTNGSIETTRDEKRKLAAASLAFNCHPKNTTFRETFPHLVQLYDDMEDYFVNDEIASLVEAERAKA